MLTITVIHSHPITLEEKRSANTLLSTAHCNAELCQIKEREIWMSVCETLGKSHLPSLKSVLLKEGLELDEL